MNRSATGDQNSEKDYYSLPYHRDMHKGDWIRVVDASGNKAKATKDGYRHRLDPVNARTIRVNMLKNSANPGVHIVECRAY